MLLLQDRRLERVKVAASVCRLNRLLEAQRVVQRRREEAEELLAALDGLRKEWWSKRIQVKKVSH